MDDIVATLRVEAAVADSGDYPEDAYQWAITMRSAADKIERLLRDYLDPRPRMRCGAEGKICMCEAMIGRDRVGLGCPYPQTKLNIQQG